MRVFVIIAIKKKGKKSKIHHFDRVGSSSVNNSRKILATAILLQTYQRVSFKYETRRLFEIVHITENIFSTGSLKISNERNISDRDAGRSRTFNSYPTIRRENKWSYFRRHRTRYSGSPKETSTTEILERDRPFDRV